MLATIHGELPLNLLGGDGRYECLGYATLRREIHLDARRVKGPLIGGGNGHCRGDGADEDEQGEAHGLSKAAVPGASTPLGIAFGARRGNRSIHVFDGA